MERKECYFDFGQLDLISAKKVEIIVRNGGRELSLGDVIGGRRIMAIELDGLDSDTLPIGMTAKITLNGMPLLTLAGPYDLDYLGD
jgi:hypothetical protein